MADYPEIGKHSNQLSLGLEAKTGQAGTGPSRQMKENEMQKAAQRTWSRKFIELAGSAPDFPYPDDLLAAEPGPDFEE